MSSIVGDVLHSRHQMGVRVILLTGPIIVACQWNYRIVSNRSPYWTAVMTSTCPLEQSAGFEAGKTKPPMGKGAGQSAYQIFAHGTGGARRRRVTAASQVSQRITTTNISTHSASRAAPADPDTASRS
jgi:hypothetical protein